MTKPAVPPPARSDAIEVEIDAMDLAEWESGQSTPQASDANLAELVRRTAATPEAGVRLAATRERTRTQLGAVPTVRAPSQRARTAPPGPAPKPNRGRTAAEGSASPRPAEAAAPAAPLPSVAGPPPPKVVTPSASAPKVALPGVPSPPKAALPAVPSIPGMAAMPTAAIASKAHSTATPPGGIDFSLPVTATSEIDAPRRPLPLPPPAAGTDSRPVTANGWTDFDLPVTTIGERPQAVEPRGAPAGSPRSGSAPNGIDFAVPVTATSQSGARRPGSEPRSSEPTPSVFAEASHVGPGRNASPAGSAEPNTAWPPRPKPAEVWSRPEQPAAPEASVQRPAPDARPDVRPDARPDARRDAAPDAAPDAPGNGAERLQVLSRRRLYWIAGAIGGLAIAAVIAAASFGSSGDTVASSARTGRAGSSGRASAAAARDPASATDDDDTPGAASATSGAGSAGATGGRSAPMDPAARAMSAQRTWRLAIGAIEGATDATVGPAPRPRHRSGPTKVVIDYRAKPNEALPVAAAAQTDEDAAIDSARGAYNRGNQRLFVGDLEGAVRAYRESLDLYPGYVGGFRGLGLAYAELGEKTSAIEALKAYVAAAPSARDIALIKKRIARLQGK